MNLFIFNYLIKYSFYSFLSVDEFYIVRYPIVSTRDFVSMVYSVCYIVKLVGKIICRLSVSLLYWRCVLKEEMHNAVYYWLRCRISIFCTDDST